MSDQPVMGHIGHSPDFKATQLPPVNPALITTPLSSDLARFKGWLTRAGQSFDERKHEVGTQVVVEDQDSETLISVLFHPDGRFRKILAGPL